MMVMSVIMSIVMNIRLRMRFGMCVHGTKVGNEIERDVIGYCTLSRCLPTPYPNVIKLMRSAESIALAFMPGMV